MTTATSYATVKECFDRVYEQLREDNQENAPNSFTWFAPTFGELIEEIGSAGIIDDRPIAETCEVIGDPEATGIAWVYECNNRSMWRITEGASENELVTLFGRCMGYEL